MKKIIIIGNSGAGKSTLALKLHQITGLPLVHLDQHYWKAGWVASDKATWKAQVEQFIQKDHWIMDGNFRGTMDIRIAAADTIIYLDRSRWVCLYRVLKRTTRYYRKTRPDVTEGCHERFDWHFICYIFFFNSRRKPGILKRVRNLKPHQQLFILRSNRAIKKFLRMQVLAPPPLPKKRL